MATMPYPERYVRDDDDDDVKQPNELRCIRDSGLDYERGNLDESTDHGTRTNERTDETTRTRDDTDEYARLRRKR